jgi:NADH-quinone oxidoreductase subunit N
MNLASLPPSLLGVAILTLDAVILLALAGPLTARTGTLTALGLLAVVMAALPALAAGSSDAPAVLAVLGVAGLALLLLPSLELEDETQRVELAALLLLGSAGGIVLATADNLLSLAVGLETLSLSVVIMTALCQGQRPLEAAFKNFVLATVSLAALIYGIGLIALSTGSLALAAEPPSEPGQQLLYGAGLVLVALGFAFELAVVPLHWGALNTYLAAAPALAGYVMSVSKLAAVLALSKLAVMAGAPVGAVLIGLGVLSIAWGTIGALAQRDLRGLLGYSAIANAGFLALAVGSGPDGRVAAVFYALVYAAGVMLVFASLGGYGAGPLPLAGLRGAGFGPLRALALCLALLSLAGIPPAPGFWAKLAILGPAWTYAGIGPTVVAVIGGVAGALYYLKPLPDLFAAVREGVQHPLPAPALAGAAVALAGLAVIAFGLAPALAYALASLSQAPV